MLGCGAHVRIIALPHVRCACGKGLKLCVRCACVRLIFGRAMCDRTFAHVFGKKDQIMSVFRGFQGVSIKTWQKNEWRIKIFWIQQIPRGFLLKKKWQNYECSKKIHEKLLKSKLKKIGIWIKFLEMCECGCDLLKTEVRAKVRAELFLRCGRACAARGNLSQPNVWFLWSSLDGIGLCFCWTYIDPSYFPPDN